MDYVLDLDQKNISVKKIETGSGVFHVHFQQVIVKNPCSIFLPGVLIPMCR